MVSGKGGGSRSGPGGVHDVREVGDDTVEARLPQPLTSTVVRVKVRVRVRVRVRARARVRVRVRVVVQPVVGRGHVEVEGDVMHVRPQ